MNGRLLLGPFIAGVLAARAVSGQPVATFRGDVARTGIYASPGVPAFTKVKWTFKTDGRIIASPAIANGLAYVGATDGYMYAVDTETGDLRWKFQTRSRIASSAAVANGVVYFLSYDGKFYALDASTGRARWIFRTQGERRFAATNIHGFQPEAERMPDAFDLYLSSPAVSQGVVYFGSSDGNVYALDAATGRLKWKFQTGDVVHASPAVANGAVFIGSWDTYFYSLDAATGKLRWRFKTGADPRIHNQEGIPSSAAVVGGAVYFGCRDGHLYSLDAATGAKRWAFSTSGGWVIASPAVRHNRVYMATADGRWFRELDTDTGTNLFAQQFSWYLFASPAIVDTVAYVAGWDGRLTAIDLESRRTLWTFQTESSSKNIAAWTNPTGAMLFNGNGVVDRTGWADEMPIAVNLSLAALGAFVSSPVIVGGVVYIGSMDGYLYAIT